MCGKGFPPAPSIFLWACLCSQALWKCLCCSCSDLPHPCLASASLSPCLEAGESTHLPFVGVVCCLPATPGKGKNNHVWLLQKVGKLISQVTVVISGVRSFSLSASGFKREGAGMEHLIPDPISAPVPFGAPRWQSHLSITHGTPALAQFEKLWVI